MAGFHTKTFLKHDDYMTPKHAWEDIKEYIPKNKIWEAFYGDGTSGNYLTELGFDVIHEPLDFFTEPPEEYETIVSNPPFSKSKEVLSRLKELDKPFILILPTQKLNTCYMRDSFMDKLQIIIPRKRINFLKLIDGQPVEGYKNQCSFDCYYYCYKMNFPKDIVWLE